MTAYHRRGLLFENEGIRRKERTKPGPFSIEQIREEIEAGRLHEQDLACHDGANWIRLKDLPGLFQQPAAKVDRPVGGQRKAQDNMVHPARLRMLHPGGLGNFSLLLRQRTSQGSKSQFFIRQARMES